MATAVPHKGSLGSFGVDKCLEFMEELGDETNTVVVKGDQEPAMVALLELIKRAWDGNAALEHSPVGESEANGNVERYIGRLKHGVAMKMMQSNMPITTWYCAMRHAAIHTYGRN